MKIAMRFVLVARLVMSMVLGAGLMASAKAQTVLIDFGNNTSFRGASVVNPDSKGNYWNSIAPGPFITNLIDTKNNARRSTWGSTPPSVPTASMGRRA